MVFWANTRNKTDHTMWKGMENCARKWCLFLCTILFEVTWVFWKMCRVSLWSVLLKRIFIHKEHELVVSPYEADNAEFTTYISTEPSKYVKLYVIAKSNPNHREMAEQSSLCSLPTGSETSNQKSENVESFATSITTNDPSFVMIGFIKTQLHPQGTWTCVIPLWGWQCGIYHLYFYRASKIREFAY